MSDGTREVLATEFDWFAMDREGRLALFATAGWGPVPDTVLALATAYDRVGESIEVVGWGSAAVWQSYSRVGLYVYDWSESKERYVLIAEPITPVPADLSAVISSIPDLPCLALSFALTSEVTPDW